MLPAPPVDFNNFTYVHQPCGKTPLTMRAGHADFDMPDIGQTLSLDMGKVYRGRMGTREIAVVVLMCGLPVGSNSDAYAYAIDGARAIYLAHLGSVAAGEGGYAPDAWIRVKFVGDLLVVDVLDDPEDAPNKWTGSTYRLVGDALRVVRRG